MSLSDLLAGGSGVLVAALTLVQISPIKVNPWSALARALGRAINGGDVMGEIKNTRNALDVHIADGNRARILAFNARILQGINHTEEEFVDILACIDQYEHYCTDHPKYKNNRAVHAIANIERVYDERLKKHDFL